MGWFIDSLRHSKFRSKKLVKKVKKVKKALLLPGRYSTKRVFFVYNYCCFSKSHYVILLSSVIATVFNLLIISSLISISLWEIMIMKITKNLLVTLMEAK